MHLPPESPQHCGQPFPEAVIVEVAASRGWRPALVSHRVMQQARNGLVLAAAILQHQRGHTEQVGNVTDLRALPSLTGV